MEVIWIKYFKKQCMHNTYTVRVCWYVDYIRHWKGSFSNFEFISSVKQFIYEKSVEEISVRLTKIKISVAHK